MKIISKSYDFHMEDEDENTNEEEIVLKEGLGEKYKTQKKNDMSTAKDTEGIPLPFQEPEFAATWAEWLQYRRENRWKAFTPTGLRRTFKTLLVDSGGDCKTAIEMINNAMAKSWQGIHPLKQPYNGNINSGFTKKPKPTGTVAPGGFGQL